jgi:SAM-dependent methyltransferase
VLWDVRASKPSALGRICGSGGFVNRLPWWLKLAGKLALSRLPVGHEFWRSAKLFRHGDMANAGYALQVMRDHLDRVAFVDLHERSLLELGPGDSVGTAIIGCALGARSVLLVDSAPFAIREVSIYAGMAERFRALGLPAPRLDGCSTLEDVLARCRARYLTSGLASLRTIDASSVDFVFSHAVLEHVRAADLQATLRELRRISRPGSVGSHQVDLRDHLGGALNNLRFPDRFWEAEWVARSGFYTNRVRCSELNRMLREAGFRTEVCRVRRWGALPTPLSSMASRFRSIPEEDLRVSEVGVVTWAE